MVRKRKSERPTSNVQYPMSKDGLNLLVKENGYDLEDRLIDFAVRIIRLSAVLPDTRAGVHIAGQILRSGTSPAPNYGEAQAAESAADFIHKLKIALKELRETLIWLKLVSRAFLIKSTDLLAPLMRENDELIAILFASVKTAGKGKV